MRENYLSSQDQFASLNNNPIAAFNARYHKKYTNQRLLAQETSIKGSIFNTTKTIPSSNNNRNLSTIH